MAAAALVVSILAVFASLGIGVASIIYVRRQAHAAQQQVALARAARHDARTPRWGDPRIEESGSDDSWTVYLPLASDTPLRSATLEVVAEPGQKVGLFLQGGAEGAPAGVGLGDHATWRLGVDKHGDPTTRTRIVATDDTGDSWVTSVELPFSQYMWRDLTIL